MTYFNLSKLNYDDSVDLIKNVYSIHKEIFKGVPFNKFLRTILHKDSLYNGIKLFRKEDKTIGYCASHVFISESEHNNPIKILRFEGGFLPKYRGKALHLSFVLTESVKHKMKHFKNDLYLFSTPISPISYYFLHKYYGEIYPSPSRKPSSRFQKIIRTLTKQFYPEISMGQKCPKTVAAGWISIERKNRKGELEFPTNQIIDFYLKNNPDFRLGTGLVTVTPINWKTLVHFFLMFSFTKSKLFSKKILQIKSSHKRN